MAKRRTMPEALGAYVFAGGFTEGVRRHFDVKAVLEETDYGVAVARDNMPDVPVHVGLPRAPLAGWPAVAKDWKAWRGVPFLYGNPPCAAWSVAGASMRPDIKQRDWTTDPRVDCARRHFGLLEELRPEAWAWESVPQAFSTGWPLVRDLTERALALKYNVTYLHHDARYLGLPQMRKRFFMVCTRFEFDVEMPEPLFETIACGDALRGINDPGEPVQHHIGKYPKLLKAGKPGEDLRHTWERLNADESKWKRHPNGFVVGRPPFTIKKPRPERPSNVVMHEMVHPSEPRALSMKELATLCGFPPLWRWPEPNRVGDHSLVARGVCPPVGAWLAENVARCLADDVRNRKPKVKLIDVSAPPGLSIDPYALPPAQVDLPWDGDGDPPARAYVGQPKTGKPPGERKPRAPGQPRGPFDKAAFVASLPPAPKGAAPKPGQGSGAFIRDLLMAGRHSTGEILAAVHAAYPDARTTTSDVSWNKIKLKKDGKIVPPMVRG